ncbi:multidrug effflux MFS transporter [Dickeya zeae]|uniref:multidrug effflux MFS transporter n=1 Tax=Dickeya zeae TaxID=204042 RepID=UPI002098148B|nr:multidrug effflux MFS transporter [Dickeya zeae]MCO7264022.1 multidrug effflux MFS transporter [Dickeya zeae]
MNNKTVLMPGDRLTPHYRRDIRILIILSTLMSFASIATDLYLPAMPTISQQLRMPHGGIELTLSGFLVGFSVGQLFWGPIGDRFGRRLPIFVGLAIFALGSVGCALSTTAGKLIAWRAIQALGACAGPVLARAMVRDLYSREQAAQMLSTLIMFMAVAPLCGPLLGGQILAYANWQAIFWVMAAMGGVAVIATVVLPETLPVAVRSTVPLAEAFKAYLPLLRHKRIMGYAIASTCYYGGFYVFIAGTPFVYIDYYQVPSQAYGLLFGVNIIGVMLANFFNRRLVLSWGSERLFHLGSRLAAFAGVIMAINAWTGWFGIAGLIVPFLLYAAMNGFIVANAVAGALADATGRVGACSSLIGAMQYGSGIISASVLGWLADGTPWPMGGLIGVCALGISLTAGLMPNAPVISRDSAARR